MADFDHIANQYDTDFTHSVIGKAQRQLVYHQLEKLQMDWGSSTILELNCGTGQDAIYFAQKGANVLATDISPEMVLVTQEKTKQGSNVSAELLDINELASFHPGRKYDLIFSNFGGLNCLNPDELKLFLKNAATKLNENGKLILVIMTSFTLWETLYFSGKMKFNEAFRRSQKNGVNANVEGNSVKTFYYSPSQISKWAPNLKTAQISPIGFFVPPSYLANFFQKRPNTIHKWMKMDQKIENSSFFASKADHFLICLER